MNIHGRKWGRGIRPYLLIPKLVFITLFVGGAFSLLMLAYIDVPTTPDAWRQHADLVRQAYTRVIVPGLIGALCMGTLLASQHFGAFIRMRWFRVKISLIVLFVPSFHLFMRNRALALRATIDESHDWAAAEVFRSQMLVGTVAVLVLALVIIFLGRVKPRLGQDYGRTFARTATRANGQSDCPTSSPGQLPTPLSSHHEDGCL